MIKVKPFLKWVGGKNQLLSRFEKLYPVKYGNYFEPFVGGGAVYFSINPQKAYLNDNNKTLIATYKYIKNDLNKIIPELKKLQKNYYKKDEVEREDFYYKIRSKFNDFHKESLKKSACLIFLNKTCYNGMYRENSKGHFNVPFGRYENPKIINEENLIAVSELLKNTNLTSVDFKKSVKRAKRGDFVYFDPPYHPINSTSNFTKYSEKDFLEKEQIRLKKTFDDLSKKGVLVMLSNSNTNFISKLYKDYKRIVVTANRMVNCKSDGKGKIKELVILNY